jgi:uncharacterized protein YheU (UPF0270 family)
VDGACETEGTDADEAEGTISTKKRRVKTQLVAVSWREVKILTAL